MTPRLGDTMRRLMIGLTAACLLGALYVPAMALEPTSPPSFGGRVELPESGVAVTFPEGWLTFDLAADIDARVKSIETALGDVFPVGRDALVADLKRRSASSELLGLSLDEQACDLRLISSSRVDLHDPAFVAQLDAAIQAEQGIKDYSGVAPVDLPAGPAVTYGWVQVGADPQGRDLAHSGYMVDGGDRGVVFTCEGLKRPDDDWRSIADTIEFLPQPGPPSLVGIGGRAEVPEVGVALTWPDDWVWARYSEFGTDALVEQLADATGPAYAAEHRLLLSEIEEVSPLIGWPRDGDGSCVLGAYRTDQGLEAVSSDAKTYIEADAVLFPGGVAMTELAIGGVKAVRLDYTQADPDRPPPSVGTQYLLVHEGASYYIGCVADQAPEDRWLSIAQTLELLPGGE